MVDVSNHEYRKVYALLFGVAVMVMLIFFCFGTGCDGAGEGGARLVPDPHYQRFVVAGDDGTIASVKIGNRHHVPYPEYRRLWEETMTRVLDASIDDIEAELFADE